MKKLVSFVLLLALIVSVTGCAGGMSPVEKVLLAVKKLDIDTLETLLTAETKSVAARMRDYNGALDVEKRDVLLSLYSLLQYTMGKETEPENGVKTLDITLKIPDMARIKSLAEANSLVSGASAYESVRTMIRDGTVEKSYMTEKKIKVRLEEEDGAWRIPYSETANAELLNALYLTEMLRFFSLN